MITNIGKEKNFKCQGYYSKAKGQIKVTPWHCTPTPHNQCPYCYDTFSTKYYCIGLPVIQAYM